MKTMKLKMFLLVGGLGFLLAACATTKPDVYSDIDLAVSEDNFDGGIAEIMAGQEAAKPIYPESNAISFRLDKGLLEHYAGNYGESAQDLMEAERLIEEAFTKSVSEAVASYITNDNSKEYPGEDYEDIYISVFNALNFYHQGDVEGALVEIRKLTLSSGKLDMLSRKYDDARKSAGAWLLEQLGKIGFKLDAGLPQGEAVNFSDSALARYLSVLFYLAEKNVDSARIEHEKLGEAFANNPEIYYHSPPSFIPDMGTVPEGKGRLHIIGFAGLSPIKQEGLFEQFFPFFKYPALQKPQFKLPRLVPRDNSAAHTIQVTAAEGGESVNLELIEDMGAVMTETFGARFGNIFFKTYIRTMLKYAAADIAARQAEQRTGALAAQVIALAAQKAMDATEHADIRMGRFLPDKAYVGYIDLDPGVHTITVTFDGGVTREFTDVDVREGGLNLIQAVSLRGNRQGSGGGRATTASAEGRPASRPARPPAPAAAPAATPAAAPEAAPVAEKPRLGILRFSGGTGDDGETMAALFSVQNDLRSAFTIVPRTAEVNEIVSGKDYQSSLSFNYGAVARMGRTLEADYMLAGYIRPAGDRALVVAGIVHVATASLVGGGYSVYGSPEELPAIVQSMTGKIAAAAKRGEAGLPLLAVASGTDGTEAMTQLLLVEIANSGSYAVQGTQAKAAFVLATGTVSLGNSSVILAQLFKTETNSQLSEGTFNYSAFESGMEHVPALAAQLLAGVTASAADAIAAAPAGTETPAGADGVADASAGADGMADASAGADGMADASAGAAESASAQPDQSGSAGYAGPEPSSSDAWKNKWLYLGIHGGFGWYHYTDFWYSPYYPYSMEEKESGVFNTFGLSAELALLKFFSVEMDLNYAKVKESHDDNDFSRLLVPMLARLGGRFWHVELSADVGYVVNLGFAFGGTFGVHIGPVILFYKYLGLPNANPGGTADPSWVHYNVWGLKFGLIDKKK